MILYKKSICLTALLCLQPVFSHPVVPQQNQERRYNPLKLFCGGIAVFSGLVALKTARDYRTYKKSDRTQIGTDRDATNINRFTTRYLTSSAMCAASTGFLGWLTGSFRR